MDPRRSHRGQSTVEYVGIVVLLAILLGAVGWWAARHVRAPAKPPDLIEHGWEGIDKIAPPPLVVPGVDPPRRTNERRFLRVVRRVGRVVRRGGRIVVVGASEFVLGFGDGLKTAVEDFVRDPIGALKDGGGLLDELARDPIGFTKAQLDAAIDYARELAKLPPEEAYRRFMHDLGEVAAEEAVGHGKKAAAKAIKRALKRRLERASGRPGTPSGADPAPENGVDK